MFTGFPEVASWQHVGARAGFEVAFFTGRDGGWRVEGTTTATEDGQSWIVDYMIDVDDAWRTRSARVIGRAGGEPTVRLIKADGAGGWLIDGVEAPHLSGCVDLDLEASAMTNTFPVHRLSFPPGHAVPAPAAYVRAVGLGVEWLDQSYTPAGDRQFDYASPAFDFSCRLVYDRHGLILDYPGIAVRAH